MWTNSADELTDDQIEWQEETPNVLSADDLSDDQIEWQQPAAEAPMGGEDAMPAATPMPAAEPMPLLENEPQEAESIWDDPSFTGKKPKEKRPFSIGETAKLGGKGLAQSVTTEIPRMIGDAARFAGTYDSSIVEKSGQRIRETARGLGMPMMPQGAGQKAFPAESGDVAGIGTFGKDVSDWADEKAKQWYGEKPQDLNWVENAVYEGTKMLGPSLIPGGVLFKGAKILLGVGNTVKAAKYATETGNLIKSAELMAEAQAATKTAMKAASLGTAGLFGASQAQQTMDAANQKADLFEKQGKPEEAARMREIANGLAPILSGGIEAAGEYFGTKYLGKLFRLDEAEVIKRGAANLIKDFLKTLGVEVGTEMGQQAGEAAVEKYSGIRPEAEPLAEALEVVGPTIFMTILTAGTGAAYQRVAGQGKAGKADTVKVSEAAASLQKGIDDGTWTVDDVRAMRDKIKPDSPLYGEMSKVIDGQVQPPETAGQPPVEQPVTEIAKEAPKGKRLSDLEAIITKSVDLEKIGAKPEDIQAFEVTLSKKAVKAISRIGKALGLEITFYEGVGAVDGFNGLMDSDTGKIFINKNAEAPYLVTFGHESLHRLKRDHQDLYDKLVEGVRQSGPEIEQYLADLNKSRVARGAPKIELESALGTEEFIADFVGTQFTKPEFWKALAKQDPTLSRKLSGIVSDIVSAVRKALHLAKENGEAVDPKLYEHLNSMQDALASVYAEFARRETQVTDETMKPVEPKVEPKVEPLTDEQKAARAAEMPLQIEFDHIVKGMTDRQKKAGAKVLAATDAPIRQRLKALKAGLEKMRELESASKQKPAEPAGDLGDLTNEQIAKMTPAERARAVLGTEASDAEIDTMVKQIEAFERSSSVVKTPEIELADLIASLDEGQAASVKDLIKDTSMPIKERLGLMRADLAAYDMKHPKPKEKPVKKAKQSKAGKNVRTLRGAINAMGGIRWSGQFKGERKNWAKASNMLTNEKTGIPWDTMEQILKDDGWLDADENLLDVLTDETNLKRDRVITDFAEKKKINLTDQEKQIKTEMEHEVEEPPPGNYKEMNAEDLPVGKELTIIENESTRGWDVYKVVDSDPFGVTLKDGTTIELSPLDKVLVRKQDMAASVKGPGNWFKLGQDVAQKYNDQDKTGKATILKPDRKIMAQVARDMGISLEDAMIAAGVYNSESPAEAMKAIARKAPAPSAAETITEAARIAKTATKGMTHDQINKAEVPTPMQRGDTKTVGEYVVKMEAYTEQRGEDGSFHNVWRVYDKAGNRVSNKMFTSESAAASFAEGLAEEGARLSIKRYEELSAKQKKAFARGIEMLPNGKQVENKIRKKFKGTQYEKAAIQSVLTRIGIEDRIAGKEPNYWNPTSTPKANGFRKAFKEHGKDGVWHYLAEYGILSHPTKPINSIAGSYITCHPSPNCASVCYATNNRSYANIFIKAEAGNWAIETDPVRAARVAARQYKSMLEMVVSPDALVKALRMFDRGEVGNLDAWTQFIKGLNDQKIRTQTFSKRPDFLRMIDPINLRLLSVDYSNPQLAKKNPDLKLAFMYRGEQDLSLLEDLRPQMQVILPLVRKVGNKTRFLPKEQIEKLPAWAEDYLCPIDSGAKELGKKGDQDETKWNCTKCDTDGELPGCFFGQSTKQVFNDITIPLTELNIDDTIQDILTFAKGITDANKREQLHQDVALLLSEIREGGDPGTKSGIETEVPGRTGSAEKRKRRVQGAARGKQKSEGITDKDSGKFSVKSVKPWPKDFPNATVHTNLQTLRAHADYQAAKTGTAEAAFKVASDLVNVAKAKQLGKNHPNAILLPVLQREEAGRNLLPQALAKAISKHSGLPVADDIIEIHRAGRTDKSALEKLTARPTFKGEVKAGQEYILVDDAIAQGGTISELRHFVDNAGAKTVNVSSLAAAQYSATIAPSDATIEKIKEKFGREKTEQFLKDYDIAGSLEALTEREASYILKFRSLDGIRTRAVAEGIPGIGQVFQRGLWNREITDEDTTLSSAEEARFSPKWKKPGQMELPIFKGQQFELDFGEKGINVHYEKPGPKPAEPVAPAVPKAKKVKPNKFGVQGRNQRVRMATTGSIAASGMVAKDTADVAAILAGIRKSAQEQLYTVSTDKNGLILEIHKYTKGLFASAPLNGVELVGHILNVEGAKTVYFVHNHPSGSVEPSPEDQNARKYLSIIAKELQGIDIKGLVIGGTSWVDLEIGQAEKIRATVRKLKLPVKERYLQKRIDIDKVPIVANSKAAFDYMWKVHNNAEGFLFFDAKMKPAGFVPLKKTTTKQMARELLKASESLNAAAYLFNSHTKLDDPATSNRGHFIKNMTQKLGDALQLKEIIEAGRSLADSGELARYNLRSQGVGFGMGMLGADDPLFSVKTGPVWHSQMTKALAEKLPGKGTPATMLQTIKSFANKGEFKTEEFKWSGIEQWLGLRATDAKMFPNRGKVTRQEVMDYLAANQVNIVEVEKTEHGKADPHLEGLIVEDDMMWSEAENIEPDEEWLAEEIAHYMSEDPDLDEETAMEWAYDSWYEFGISARVSESQSYWSINFSNLDNVYEIIDEDGGFVEQVDLPGTNLLNVQDRVFEILQERGLAISNADAEEREEAEIVRHDASNLQTPGGKDYRELLLTMPQAPGQQVFDEKKVEIHRKIRSVTQGSTDLFYDGKLLASYIDDPVLQANGKYEQKSDAHWMDMARAVFERGDTRNRISSQSGAFTTGHWTEANILAHTRFNSRIDAEGRRTLFIEEVQSDWHQQGRREGYGNKIWTQKDVEVKGNTIKLKGTGVEVYNGMDIPVEIKIKKALEYFNANVKRPLGVPDAPFKKTWPMLIIKRMVRYAAENGYDQIAWTTGEMQADRYDLSKQLKELAYNKVTAENRSMAAQQVDEYQLEGILTDGRVHNFGSFSEAELEGVVGKELAEKMIKGEGKKSDARVIGGLKGANIFSGIDLKVGGEGMKAFYDKMLVNEANKFFNKAAWGKAKVDKIEIELTGQRTEGGETRPTSFRELSDKAKVWSLPITQEMRAKATTEGMPMFSAKKAPVWHSQMTNVLAEKLPGKGTPAQMIEVINKLAGPTEDITNEISTLEKTDSKDPLVLQRLKELRKQAGQFKGEFKREELAWSGLEDWLNASQVRMEDQWVEKEVMSQGTIDLRQITYEEYLLGQDEELEKYNKIASNLREQAAKQKFKVSKQDILDYLKDHAIEINETRYYYDEKGESNADAFPSYGRLSIPWPEDAGDNYKATWTNPINDKEHTFEIDTLDNSWLLYVDDQIVDTAETELEARNKAVDYVDDLFEETITENSKLDWQQGEREDEWVATDWDGLTGEAAEWRIWRDTVRDENGHIYIYIELNGEHWDDTADSIPEAKESVHIYIEDQIRRTIDMAGGMDEVDDFISSLHEPQFATYQMPGGKNYQELTLTLPVGSSAERNRLIDVYQKKYGGIYGHDFQYEDLTQEERIAITQAARAADQGVLDKKIYTGSHYDENNVIAHTRYNERIDDSGRRLLFLEELQSDWHEDARREGYYREIPFTKDDIIITEGDNEYIIDVKEPHGGSSVKAIGKGIVGSVEEARDYAYKILSEYKGTLKLGVPDAPFKKTWPMLIFKRMVRYAVNNGFEAIGWTPGIVQVERYEQAFRKKVDKISWYVNSNGNKVVSATKGDKKVGLFELNEKGIASEYAYPSGAAGKHISEIIGKALGKRVMAEKDAVVTGDDLTIGGEGMKGFYDRMLVNQVNNFFGKNDWGNARVEVGKVSTVQDATSEGFFNWLEENGYDATDLSQIEERALIQKWEKSGQGAKSKQVWILPVTTEMRQKALEEGMPLFQVKRTLGIPTVTDTATQDYRAKFSSKTDEDAGQAAAKKFNADNPDNTIRFDGMWDLSAMDMPSKFQFTVYSGDALAATFVTDTAKPEDVTAKFWQIAGPIMANKARLSVKKKLEPAAQVYLNALKAAMPDAFVETADSNADPYEGLDPEIKKQLQASKGLGRVALKERIASTITEIWRSSRRHRPYLDPKEYADVANVLRIHQEVPANSSRRAIQALGAIVGQMKPKQYEIFSNKLIMEDMSKDVESGLLDDPNSLPFGFTVQSARNFLGRLNTIVAADPVISDALRRRDLFNKALKRALVEADLLPEAVLDDDRYWHHQVLQYRAARELGEKYQPGIGVSSQDVRLKRKGWQKSRIGSDKNYNTDYAESEFEVIAQAFSQLETKATMERIEGLVNEAPALKTQAKYKNLNNLYMIEAKRQSDMDPSGHTWTIADVKEKADPLKVFSSDIAKGLRWLGDMAKKGELYSSAGQDFSDVIEAILEWRIDVAIEAKEAKEDGRDPELIPFPFDEEGRVWAYFNHMMKENHDGAAAPGMIFKAIRQKNAFIKEYLGKKFLTAKDLMADDQTIWIPAPGSSWYKAYSISDRLVDAVQAGEMVIGTENADKIRQILARGRDVEWIIPTGIAKTLDGYDAQYEDHMLSRASAQIMRAWKQWILINPYRVVKYNVNNMSGDLDIAIAYDPKIVFKYFPGAVKDLTKAVRGKPLSPELQKEIDLAYTLGVVGSGWSVQEVADVGTELAFDRHMQALTGQKPALIQRTWRGLQGFTNYRENLLRLAAFRYFRNELTKAKAAKIKGGIYGASNKAEVDGIENLEEKAAKLARELIGDYGNITHSGQWIRRHMIPFYAWMEVNAPRYARLVANIKHEGQGAKKIGRSVAMASAKIPWKLTKLGMKASALFILANLWNRMFFPDEDDELGEAQRRQLHLIFGRREDGSIVSLRFQGALSDALSWFALEDAPKDIEDVIKGKKSITTMAGEAALAPWIKLINALRPDVKAFSEVLSGQSFYPDPFNPRPVRDKLEHVLRTFSADQAYRWIADKPKRGDTVGERLVNDLMQLGFYNSDPGEQAYYDIKAKTFEFLDTKGVERPSVTPTSKSNALYYYKQALKFGDLGAAEKYLAKYKALGGTDTGVTQSLGRSAPLGSLAKKYHREFLGTLTPEEKERYDLALKWFNATYHSQKGLKDPLQMIESAPQGADAPLEEDSPAAGNTLREILKLSNEQ